MSKETRLFFPPALAGLVRASGCDIVVTGGSGWIGQATLEMLESALGDELDGRIAVFGSADGSFKLRSGKAIAYRELKHIANLNAKPKIFVHCAFITKDHLLDQDAASFIAANEKISDAVAAAIDKFDVRGIFMPSSGAVYKAGTRELDGDLEQNAYGVMKVRDEQRFTRIATAKNMPLSVPRLFNLSGPYINKHKLYALASIIQSVLDGKPIKIRSSRKVVRSYIHVAELVTLGFSMLLQPHADDSAIFDSAGNEALEIGGLAEKVRTALNRTEIKIERPDMAAGNDDVYVGDGAALRKMLQARAMTPMPIDQQIRDTAEYMRHLIAA